MGAPCGKASHQFAAWQVKSNVEATMHATDETPDARAFWLSHWPFHSSSQVTKLAVLMLAHLLQPHFDH
jgi:hypothetical protein